jgi:hypothetical protein
MLVDVVVAAVTPYPTIPFESRDDLSPIGLDQVCLQVRKYLRIVATADKGVL